VLKSQPQPQAAAAGAQSKAHSAGMNGHSVSFPTQVFLDSEERPLIKLNERYAVIGDVGGKCLVLGWVPSKVDEAVRLPSFQSFKSFAERYGHKRVNIPEPDSNGNLQDKFHPLGAYWLKWKGRQTFEGIDLVPGRPAVLPGTVTVAGAQSFQELDFLADGYVLQGDTLTGTSQSLIFTDAGVTATINNVIDGNNGLDKEGDGTLVLTAANTSWTTVPTGHTGSYIYLFKDTGTAATSPLICIWDTGTGIPVTTTGGNISDMFSYMVLIPLLLALNDCDLHLISVFLMDFSESVCRYSGETMLSRRHTLGHLCFFFFEI
jgi:hypothetical protein